MARIELREAYIRVRDGLAGTGNVTSNSASASTTLNVDTIVLNATTTNLVPVGARLTVNSCGTNIFTVTERTPPAAGPTLNLVVTPALTANVTQNDVITFSAQRLTVKVGEGSVSWTEAKEYEYLRDRGDLDTVREADEQPIDVSIDFVYEYITTETGEDVTIVDALKQTGEASEWVTSSSDVCEPYAVDIEIMHCMPCGTVEDEKVVLADFRYESLEFDINEATISTSGRCNVSEATVTRADYADEGC